MTPDCDWPLRFRTPGEAVEMCIDALENYERYLKLLFDGLERRYAAPVDWGEHVRKVWGKYISCSTKKYL